MPGWLNGLPWASRSVPDRKSRSLKAYQAGWFAVQDEAAQLIGFLLDPRPGETVLDACAAPGGKATHLAASMGNSGAVVALESDPGQDRQDQGEQPAAWRDDRKARSGRCDDVPRRHVRQDPDRRTLLGPGRAEEAPGRQMEQERGHHPGAGTDPARHPEQLRVSSQTRRRPRLCHLHDRTRGERGDRARALSRKARAYSGSTTPGRSFPERREGLWTKPRSSGPSLKRRTWTVFSELAWSERNNGDNPRLCARFSAIPIPLILQSHLILASYSDSE